MQSKENTLLELFFNSSQYWHFEELRKAVKIGKPQLARWLALFSKQGLIKRVKPKGKMPHYVQDAENPTYKMRKRLYALEQLYTSGLLEHLASLPQAKVVILFGSFTRSDWNKESDIDIFVYGDDSQLEQGKYELRLKRHIEVHTTRHRTDLKKIDKLLPSIVSGDLLKGSLYDLGVEVHAKT